MYPDNELLSTEGNVAIHAELKRLRKENKLLKMEREILKKAALCLKLNRRLRAGSLSNRYDNDPYTLQDYITA